MSVQNTVTWRSLPRKDQLLVLTLARLSEPLTQTSLQTYMFYQLRSFDPSLGDGTIASQVGLLQGGFTGMQFLTAIMWGRIADSERVGRKMVLLIGLLGTAISALGFGFSKSFGVAMAFRCIGGALNGNIGVMRTMISEIIKEKKYQSRAFLILPMTFNIGVIIGPVLGGILADPVGSYPSLFGPGSWIGGKDGVGWMIEWPYALPNLVNAVFLFLSAMSVLLSLEETHESLRQQPDLGLRIGRRLVCLLCCKNNRHGYVPVIADDVDSLSAVSQDVELPSTPVSPTSAPTFFPTTSIHNTSPTTTRPSTSYPNTYETPSPRSDYPAASNILQTAAPDGLEAQSAPDSSSSTTVDTSPVHFETPKKRERLPVSRIWTRNVISTLIAHALLALHVGTYSSLWFVFMSTPRFDPKHPIPPWLKKQHFPFYFTGGLALPPKQIGAALAVLGTIGISLQLLLYPRLSSRLGIVWSYRYSLLLFPIAYFLVPFLVMIPSTTQPPAAVGGILVWLGIVGILFIQVLARTFALPATAILVNNCCPHPSVLGTIHGIGQSVSSASRTLGPVVGSLVFAHGLNVGVVGLAWWTLMVMAALGAVAGTFVKNGNGHEILLEGEEEEEYEEESRK